MMMAQIALIQGRDQEAIQLYLASCSPHDDESEGLISAAEVLLEHHRYEEALELLAENATGGLSTAGFQAEAMLGSGEFLEAERRFQYLIPAEPPQNHPEPLPPAVAKALRESGKLYSEGGPEKALARIKRSRSGHWRLGARRAELLVELGEHQKGLEALESVLREKPRWDHGWELLEELALKLGRRGLANLARCQRQKLKSEDRQRPGLVVPVVGGRWPGRIAIGGASSSRPRPIAADRRGDALPGRSEWTLPRSGEGGLGAVVDPRPRQERVTPTRPYH